QQVRVVVRPRADALVHPHPIIRAVRPDRQLPLPLDQLRRQPVQPRLAPLVFAPALVPLLLQRVGPLALRLQERQLLVQLLLAAAAALALVQQRRQLALARPQPLVPPEPLRHPLLGEVRPQGDLLPLRLLPRQLLADVEEVPPRLLLLFRPRLLRRR